MRHRTVVLTIGQIALDNKTFTSLDASPQLTGAAVTRAVALVDGTA